jgi:hypothetical protein
MTSQKRDREVELENESAISSPTNKRPRLDTSDSANHRPDHPKVYDSPLLTVWSQPMTEQQRSFLTEKMEGWVKLRCAEIFIEPHTGERMILDAKKIKRPMDLSTMRSRLDSGKYSSVKDLVLDFRLMIGNVFRINSWMHEDSMLALRLFQCFCVGMKFCPTGPHNEQMATYSAYAMRLMASNIRVIPTKTGKSSPSKSVADDDSDESLVDDAIKHSGISPDELQGHSIVDVSDSPSLMQNELPHISGSEAVNTLEPGDLEDLDEESQRLQKEIEERQRKLANMVEKKRLLKEIRNLDTEKTAIEVKIPQMIEQLRQLDSRAVDCSKLTNSVKEKSRAAIKSRDWHDQESVRFQQESEKHRQENQRFDLVVGEYQRKMDALESETNQIWDQSEQAEITNAQLWERRDQIEDQRASAEKKLEELNNSSI